MVNYKLMFVFLFVRKRLQGYDDAAEGETQDGQDAHHRRHRLCHPVPACLHLEHDQVSTCLYEKHRKSFERVLYQ